MFILLVLFLTIINYSFEAPSVSTSLSHGSQAKGRDEFKWEQEQSGRYNLQVSLKDVQVIAVLGSSDLFDEDDDDDDYDEYDYSDMPSGSWEPKPPSNPTDEVEIEEVEETNLNEGNNVTAIGNSTNESNSTSSSSTESPNDETTTTKKRLSTSKIYHRQSPVTKRPIKSNCDPGKVRNRSGLCVVRPKRYRRPYYLPLNLEIPGLRLARRQILRKLREQNMYENKK